MAVQPGKATHTCYLWVKGTIGANTDFKFHKDWFNIYILISSITWPIWC